MSAGEDRIQAIANQIRVWAENSNFEGATGQEVDRQLADVFRNPDRFIDPELSASANWEIIKDRIGLSTQTETDELLRTIPRMQRQAAIDEVRDQLDEFGIEPVVDVIAGNPTILDPDREQDLEERVNDILDEFPPDLYDAEIQAQVQNLFSVLGEEIELIRRDRVEELRERAEQPATEQDLREFEREVRQEVVDELERAFGQRFDDVDDAIDRLRQAIAAARGERLRIADIDIRRSGGDLLIRVEDGDEFLPFEDLVRRRVRRTIDTEDFTSTTWTTVGEARVRGEEIEAIDLEEGIELLGAEEGAPEPVFEPGQQARFEIGEAEPEDEPLDEANDRAQRAIDLLES